MKEINFIRDNIERWKETENIIEHIKDTSPDVIAEVYSGITTDLAFAQTHYPDSRITLYLNNLSSAIHNHIYKNKREKWNRILTFWSDEVPLTIYSERKTLLCSFFIFIMSIFIGVISQLADPDFCRIILGNGYVDMTLENIEEGNPMGVYGTSDEGMMFLRITTNNIMVSFYAFVSGLFTCISTAMLLFYNGIMVGCFLTFFFQHELLVDSVLAIMLHGTLELSAIIIAGAAGLALGSGLLFPKTYSRIESFRRGAKRGLMIVVGTVPIFIVAGFIESFLTRHTDAPLFFRLGLIILSAVFIILYFIVLPYKKNKKNKIENNI
ncbi:MAG: stage II sporulation protein M [Bacteroidaceae bacterium]|nr:stage II sporulation protein M [Bacteroidaceae bacterium]